MKSNCTDISSSDCLDFKLNDVPVQLCNPENTLRFKQDETTINKTGKKTQHLHAALKWELDQIPIRSNLPFLSHQMKRIKTVFPKNNNYSLCLCASSMGRQTPRTFMFSCSTEFGFSQLLKQTQFVQLHKGLNSKSMYS